MRTTDEEVIGRAAPAGGSDTVTTRPPGSSSANSVRQLSDHSAGRVRDGWSGGWRRSRRRPWDATPAVVRRPATVTCVALADAIVAASDDAGSRCSAVRSAYRSHGVM